MTQNIAAYFWNKSVRVFQRVVRTNPNNSDAFFRLGLAYRGLGEYDKAIATYKQAININPDSAKAHYGLGLTYVMKGDLFCASEEFRVLDELDTLLSERLFECIYRESYV